jgi:FixJ family two-component response regulator
MLMIRTLFITGCSDIPISVRARKAGAIEFLTKPFRDQDLLVAIQLAPEKDRDRRQRDAEIATLRGRFASLTPREKKVLPLLVSGLLSKRIAPEIGTSEATIKGHHNQLRRKMGAESVADLATMAEKMGVSAPKQS